MGWFDPRPSRRQVYADYMLSPRWQDLRQQALYRDGHRCRACDTDQDLQVHHRWYPEILGDEDVGDLTTLCGPCHRAIHRNFGQRMGRVLDHPWRLWFGTVALVWVIISIAHLF